MPRLSFFSSALYHPVRWGLSWGPPPIDRFIFFSACRLLLFRPGDCARSLASPQPRALGFYRGQAYRAASFGVSVDVHCFANKACEHFGLSSIAPLALTTGGGVFRWGRGG